MAGEAPSFLVQSLFNAITALGATPAITDLEDPTAFSVLQDQFNTLVGGGVAGWRLQSQINFAPADNEVANTGVETVFPQGQPMGAVNDLDTPDGTLFRLKAGGLIVNGTGAGAIQSINILFASGVSIPFSASNPAGNTGIFHLTVDGRFIGDSGGRFLALTGSILIGGVGSTQVQNGDPTAIPIGALDAINIAAEFDTVDPAILANLTYASLEYLVPAA